MIIAVALAFDFVNGFHDAANSIATVVSTRVLTPLQGVVWAAVFNFVAAFTFGTAVAHTIGGGLIDVRRVDNLVIFCGLLGAIAWDLFTWRVGLPTSSSHALIGGYAGAAVVKAGFSVIIVSGWVKTLAFIVIAPFLGWVLGSVFIIADFLDVPQQTPTSVDHIFRRGQLVSAGLYSLGHGTNDAQKTMGIIASLLFTVPAYRHLVSHASGDLTIPFWIVLMAHAAIALGTLSGRLAHRPHHGQQDHQAGADGRLCRRNGRRGDHLCLDRAGHPGLDHPRHHRRHRRGRLDAPPPRRALGRRRADRVGLAADHPDFGADFRRLV